MFPPPDGWTTADLVYIWKEVDPVQIVKDLNLPRFKLEQFQVSCDWPATSRPRLTSDWSRRPTATRSPTRGSTAASRWCWCSSGSSPTTSSPSTCPPACSSSCPGSASGWTTGQHCDWWRAGHVITILTSDWWPGRCRPAWRWG